MKESKPPAIVSQTPLPPPTPTATPPAASPPNLTTRLHHASELRQDPALAAAITAFVNYGYKYSMAYPPNRWDHSGDRFSDPEEIHSTLGPNGIFAVTYTEAGLPVACASVSQWKGDMDGMAEEGELDGGGWEIKTVTTRVGWMKRGLAGQCVALLTEELVRQERERMECGLERRRLRLWIHVVEEINGEYWKRRGWEYVRGYDRPAGVWGSRYGFRLLVAVKDVEV